MGLIEGWNRNKITSIVFPHGIFYISTTTSSHDDRQFMLFGRNVSMDQAYHLSKRFLMLFGHSLPYISVIIKNWKKISR